MEAICTHGDVVCETQALAAALHCLHLYCSTISAVLILCCTSRQYSWSMKRWRYQNVRGVASIIISVWWCVGAAAAAVAWRAVAARLAAALLAPAAWLAAAALHLVLWSRRSTAPLLYLALYWLLVSASSAAQLGQHLLSSPSPHHVDLYVQGVTAIMALVVSFVDAICFYDEVTKNSISQPKSSNPEPTNIPYRHNCTHFYSKILFFWMNAFVYKGYESPLEKDDLGMLPNNERSMKHYQKMDNIYCRNKESKSKSHPSLWQCYSRLVWPNFYIAGVLKFFSDLIGLIPPLGLAVIITFIENPRDNLEAKSPITTEEFISNGYVMLLIITIALVLQALLSQNSSHLLTVEGIRLKTALQGMVYNKCMKLAPWSSVETESDEESPLLGTREDQTTTQTGLVTNLLSQDTYNIMSCVWICHYTWAIPLKVAAILYLLYTKLGISAIIGTAVSILIITPLQFYLGKKLSDNSKAIAKCSDHRISKMSEILQGINVIKLYVWEDLFKEKILNLREVELKLLNKDSIYWGFLNFSTQVSTILITVITFTICYFLDYNDGFTAVNVFAALALFNQLTIPLLILPVTALMIIQAMVSTKRIKEFLELPESNNVVEDNVKDSNQAIADKLNEAFIDTRPEDVASDNDNEEAVDTENGDQFSEDETLASKQEYVVRFRNAAFSWGTKNDAMLEVEDLDIPAGKLIMVVGTSGAGKSSLLSAILGEMYLERGDVVFNGRCSTWYAGQPPWLVEGSVRDNIVVGGAWCQRRYARVLRATALQPDLHLLPEGDTTRLGSHGSPLSGGQRVRVCVARALYSRARLVALDEPLGALDAGLARHVVARGLVPAVRSGRTVVVATNRLELLHYADMVIAMEDGRITGCGRAVEPHLATWAQRAAEARAAAARAGVGPPGGTARERSRLVRALSMAHHRTDDDATVGISEPPGSHLLTEMPTYSGGSWRRRKVPVIRPPLARQLSSPPPLKNYCKWRRDVRRSVSADASNTTLQREASVLRRLLQPRTQRTLRRQKQRGLRADVESAAAESADLPNGTIEDSDAETTYASLTSNGGVETTVHIPNVATVKEEQDNDISECAIWWEYARASRWWGAAYWVAAALAQTLAVAADCWLTYTILENDKQKMEHEQLWSRLRVYAAWSACGAAAAGAAGGAGAAAGGAARRALHDRLLHAALHAPLRRDAAATHALHRFSSDVNVVDKKLPTAISRWAQLAFLCGAAMLVNAALAPWSLLALLPAFFIYLLLQAVYLCTARELQRAEALSAGRVISHGAESCAGAGTIRAGRLLATMRTAFFRKLDDNHNALLLINAANRWLGLTLDLVGAATVCTTVGVALLCDGGPAVAGLAGTYSLLLPIYLSHLAKCRSDLYLQLAAVERIYADTNVAQEDYREDCPIPSGWQRNGKIDFENVSVQQDSGSSNILNNINLVVQPGEKILICGRSGSGKSTLLLSCAGATTLRSGRVLIDGQDASVVPLRALRHRVVVMPQDPVMFSGTLRENLDPLAVHTDEEIWLSLKAVGLCEFVNAQPAGLECPVGVCGGAGGWRGWRGGRAARACAARAALHAALAAALLLDEPGAALPAAAAAALLPALARANPSATILTVAHQLSSVKNYDRVVVLEDGRIVEQGPVNVLLAQPSSRLSRMLSATHRHI